MDLTNLEDLKTAMRLAGISPKKGLGQHFLIDRDSLEAIVATASITDKDTVLEIGPGLGVMTRPLASRARRVIAVEADPVMTELLTIDPADNLEVAQGDIMSYDLSNLPADYKVVANIPYYLTSKLLRHLLENPNPPSLMSLLIQKEVAERICAPPGQMSVLAFSVQYYAEAELVNMVERHKFWPAPEVDSAIIRIKRRPTPAFEADRQKLFRLVKAGFGERRKQLKNSLAGGLNASDELVGRGLEQADVLPTARAQELAVGEWHKLYNEFVKLDLL